VKDIKEIWCKVTSRVNMQVTICFIFTAVLARQVDDDFDNLFDDYKKTKSYRAASKRLGRHFGNSMDKKPKSIIGMNKKSQKRLTKGFHLNRIQESSSK
jgi:hypothetical protein